MSAAAHDTARRGRLVVISGPSGSGKTTIKRRLAQHPSIKVAVTVTTRRPRAGEVADQAYHFVDRDAFLLMQQKGLFAETNDVFSNGHLYGSLRAELEQALADAGTVYLMEVDVTGARNLKAAGYDGTYVFIAPPDMTVLERRLRERGTDDPAAIEKRLARAQAEMRQARDDGSHIVVNQSVDEAVAEVLRLIGLGPGGAGGPGAARAAGPPAGRGGTASPGRTTTSDTLRKQERS
ncbi:MAG TPA: guanylate kinase [Planctomycetota bacterium]|jgi:guanylate kinase|nr:guanylate kinase [Planctomycetota bacterium]